MKPKKRSRCGKHLCDKRTASAAAGPLTAQQQWKSEAAARRAEEAAGSAVLQLRKCCDHPQLTAFWQRHTAELQLQSGMLSIAEQNSRIADFLQNKLQACDTAFFQQNFYEIFQDKAISDRTGILVTLNACTAVLAANMLFRHIQSMEMNLRGTGSQSSVKGQLCRSLLD